jgi:hypothetical protein
VLSGAYVYDASEAPYLYSGSKHDEQALTKAKLGSAGHFIGPLTTGKWKVTFTLAYHYSVSVDVCLTSAQLYTMSPITFVRHLSKGQVRFLTSSKFTCP